MRLHSVPFALSLLILPASTVAAQTLRVEAVTTSVRPNSVSTFPVHTEHTRPGTWKAFAVSGQAELIVTAEYDINVTNTSSLPELAECGLEVSDIFLTDNFCWGTDATTPQPNLFVNEVVPANSTVRLTGSVELNRITLPYYPCAGGMVGDPIHNSAGLSALYTGPFRNSVASSDWLASPFGPASQFLSVTDLGSMIRNDLAFAMVHDLPLIAGSNGCDPLRPNSTGALGLLEAYGAVNAGEPATVLSASELPANAFGLFGISASTQPPILAGFGNATLCLGTPVLRWFDSVGRTSSSGALQVTLPTSALPTLSGQILAGETWYFQFFHRDADPASGAPTARSTNAVELMF